VRRRSNEIEHEREAQRPAEQRNAATYVAPPFFRQREPPRLVDHELARHGMAGRREAFDRGQPLARLAVLTDVDDRDDRDRNH
jgi:hypothetical protein